MLFRSHRDQFYDEIHTEKVNTRPCRFGSQGKVNTTWSGKVEVYTAVAFVAPTSKICTGAGTVCAPPSSCDSRLRNGVVTGGKLSVAFGFVTACGRVLECPVTASRLASVRSALVG